MRPSILFVVVVWVLGSVPFGFADQSMPPSSLDGLVENFQKGNKAYAVDQDYETAIAEYQKVLEAGVKHPDLYFNLANAYFRAGHKGMAVLYYEKTLMMNPSDEKAAKNLAMVRKQLIDRMAESGDPGGGEPLWYDFARTMSTGLITWTFLVFYFLTFGILVARRLLAEGTFKRLLFWINIPVISLALVFGGIFSAHVYVREKIQQGVIIAPTAPLLEGPESVANKQMELHEGLKVRLLHEAGEYVRVRLPVGAEGFIHSSQLGRI